MVVVFASAAALRLAWSGDIEYKGDERYMFEQTARPLTDAWPRVGMASGVGIANPGLSVWTFLVLSRLFGANTPPGLARAVQITNIAALVALWWLAVRGVQRDERASWLWATALAAVNPIAVLVQRKIWAQSLLPIFCVALLACWFRRDRRSGAFGWGALGGWIGQVHMTGFLFAAALWGWTVAFNSRLRRPRPTVWPAWAAGSALALVTLIPWIGIGHGLLAAVHPIDAIRRFARPSAALQYWTFWMTDLSGFGLRDSLGAAGFDDFVREPAAAGHATFAVAVLFLCSAVIVLLVPAAAARHAVASAGWIRVFIGDGTETALLIAAAFWGYGFLLTMTGVGLYRHYLLVTFPLEWLALAYLAERLHRS